VDDNGASAISLYLPARTAMVLREGEIKRFMKEMTEETAENTVKEEKAAEKKTAVKK